jgi:hypothetical protein
VDPDGATSGVCNLTCRAVRGNRTRKLSLMLRPPVNGQTLLFVWHSFCSAKNQTMSPIEGLFQDEANDARSVPFRCHRRTTA